ncbi:MAG TPA: DUF6602 domain-containing protein [Flavitalea sp.]|nr:DUF6602 domain-containing protein [Flavitalea sp.]
MAVSIQDVRFELASVYRIYSEQLQQAGGISKFLLDSSDIKSSGNEVEASLRVLLSNLLPERVNITHGHIVDKFTNVSNQQDVLIAESFFTKSLIRTLDGTEFYPFESIFAAGEVKKTWSQSKLSDAIKSITRIKRLLKRDPISSHHLLSGSNLIRLSTSITQNPVRNPLFTFTFSLDYDNTYNLSKIVDLYRNTPLEVLPNVSIVLNRGIFVYIDVEKLEHGELSIKLYPEFVSSEVKCQWALIQLESEANLAYLIFMLTQHINDSVLEKVSSMGYGQSMIDVLSSSIQLL